MSGTNLVPFQPEPEPVALVDMPLPQLAEACHGLLRLASEYENMSGVCVTLHGLVLIECKTRLGHGNFRPWLKEHFPKSFKTATRYMRLGEEFGKRDSTVTFQTLTRDLATSVAALREFQLDLSHPAVAAVAKWVGGRGAYQLMLDFPGEKGGARKRKPAADYDPNSAAEEARDLWLPHLKFLESVIDDPSLVMHLPKAELLRLKSAHIDLGKLLKKEPNE